MSDKTQNIIESIEGLTVLELNELVKAIEEKFGVSACAPVMMAGAASQTEGKQDKSEYTVILADAGSQKISVIKAVREISGLGLKEAKALVDGAPKEVKQNVPEAQAKEIQKKLEEAGAKVELK